MQLQSTLSADEIAAAIQAVSDYDFDRPRTKLVEVERLINSTHGSRAARLQIEKLMAALLTSKATVAAKQFICKKLWIIGTDLSLPALASLLEGSDPVLSEAACYALRSQDSAAALAVLRKSLTRCRGVARVAILNLLGDKKDATSAAQIITLASDPDPLLSDAAICALGKIASGESVAALDRMHRGPDPIRRLNSAHALLQAGQQLAQKGNPAAARAIWSQLVKDTEVPQIRRGASLALKG